ncbi:superfamily II RNA helicase [Mycobacteroides abscessus subsp. abscessus]|nr:superfamily II RNA helicase [Mycobacteroides abscessus subsp. abscessus]
MWVVRQIVSDPDGDHDWQIHAVVDLDASDEAEALVLTTRAFGRLD